MNATYPHKLAAQLGLPVHKVAATVELLDAGNTLPFIARYRKEATGGLDEEQIAAIMAALATLQALDERRVTVLAAITEQGKLTPELQAQIEQAATRTELEDLYAPYKQKRRTRASIARELGLQPLADLILGQARRPAPDEVAAHYCRDEIPTVDAVLAGARDIVAETISDHADVRRALREKARKFGTVTASRVAGSADERSVYQTYYDFNLRVERLRPHQVLALNRGEAQKVLRVSLEIPERDWRNAIGAIFRTDRRSPWAPHLTEAAEDGAKRLLLPSIERDVRSQLTEEAERHAIVVFGANLRGLLTQPPVTGHVVLGIDPGFRTGSKIAVVDGSGKLQATATIYPHAPQNQQRAALETLARLTQQHGVTLIAIGNGTASRETEQLAATFIRQAGHMRYVIVNEAGASVYSASPLARAELPELDVSLRGAVSIARRALDPLAELVKIDPKSIGVGLYQHDVDQKALGAALNGVVESVVNRVGVDVNTASPALLAHVAGIGPKLAEKIVAHRDTNGLFAKRADLRAVASLGPKAFEQSADGPAAVATRRFHPERAAGRTPAAARCAVGRDTVGHPGWRVERRRADIGGHLRTTGAPWPRPAHRPACADLAQRRAVDGRPGAGVEVAGHRAQRGRLRRLRGHRRQAGWSAPSQPAAVRCAPPRGRRDRRGGGGSGPRAQPHRVGVAWCGRGLGDCMTDRPQIWRMRQILSAFYPRESAASAKSAVDHYLRCMHPCSQDV